MSGMRHATISAWKREEDGSYAAELNGWALHVRWHPESATSPRGFTWDARLGTMGAPLGAAPSSAPKPPEASGGRLASDEIFEEIEVAMAHAEERVEAQTHAQAHAVPSKPHDAASHH
jgi:hypothetical protein